eukprot:SAG11_NODE_615_length_8197_cov_4.551426_4_plen_128_part_00
MGRGVHTDLFFSGFYFGLGGEKLRFQLPPRMKVRPDCDAFRSRPITWSALGSCPLLSGLVAPIMMRTYKFHHNFSTCSNTFFVSHRDPKFSQVRTRLLHLQSAARESAEGSKTVRHLRVLIWILERR